MSLNTQVRELEKLKCSVLRDKFHEMTGVETKSNNKPYLIKRIAAELYKREHAAGAAKTEPTATRAAKAESNAKQTSSKAAPAKATRTRSGKQRDPRLPPVGHVIEKEHEGKTIKIEVLDDGFRYKGENYRSLSAIAKEVTGTVWNGFLWAGLMPATSKKKRVGSEASAGSAA
jgi:hypothetical protein